MEREQLNSSMPKGGRGRGQKCPRPHELFELPAGGFGLEVFLPEGEDDSRADCEYWLFHGEDVVFHRGHVEVVFGFVPGHEFAARGDVGDFGDAFDDHGLVGKLGADYAVGIARQVAGLARLAAGAEEQASVLPEAPDNHCVRRAVGLNGGDPVIVRLLQALLGPRPREKTLRAVRKTITGGVGTAGSGSFGMSSDFLCWHDNSQESTTEDTEVSLRPSLTVCYRFFFVHWPMRSRACCRFSSEFATLKRR